ncbi:hypothetical protein G9A89_011840 [Geosiphon pyriformis]|nr:hypothetical protein G9A89_011840 [Geosiphon pyriformis]
MPEDQLNNLQVNLENSHQQSHQQQNQYNNGQELLSDQLKFQILQGYGLNPTVYAGQSLDDSVIPNSLYTGDFTIGYHNDDINQMGEVPDFGGTLFFSDLASENLSESSWLIDSVTTSPPQHQDFEKQDQQQHQQQISQSLSSLPLQGHPQLSHPPVSSMLTYNNDQVPNRAQTPGPFPRSIPNYLTARRRSLSADNIHALAKNHANANRKILLNAQSQNFEQISSADRPPFYRDTISTTSVGEYTNQNQYSNPMIKNEEEQEMMQSVINQTILHGNSISSNMSLENHHHHHHHHHHQQSNIDSDVQSIDSNDENQSLTNLQSRAQLINEPINHTQRLNERQARFKVKIDRRVPRNIPSIQVPNSTPGICSPMNAIIPAGPFPITMPSMEMPISMSTPNTPTFSPQIPNINIVPTSSPTNNPNNLNNPNNNNKLSAARRGGHMRKRSLSAPTQPFGLTGAMPLQPAQSFPFNISSVSPSFRRPGAVPIQIQRNHKHSHTATPMSSEEYQRKLNEELEKIDFEDITVSELKDMLRQRGKPATGKKAVLMQRLQDEYEAVKAMKQNNLQKPQINTNANFSNNNNQYNPILSSPTSPSGGSLHRSIANMHISSPPVHQRRFSPYGSVSIPNSPRLIPTGMGNNRATSTYNNGVFPFSAGVDEWHFNSVGIVHHPSYGSQQLAQMEENGPMLHPMMMIEPSSPSQQQQQQPTLQSQSQSHGAQQQQQQNEKFFIMQQPSSAPSTTTEFDTFQEPPSSAPATTTEFESFQQPPSSAPPMTTEFMNTYDFMRSNSMGGITMNMNEEILRMNMGTQTNINNILLKQKPGDTKDNPLQSSTPGMISSQELGFEYQEHHQMSIKPVFEFNQAPTGYMSMTNPAQSQHQLELHQVQLQQQQHQSSFGSGW